MYKKTLKEHALNNTIKVYYHASFPQVSPDCTKFPTLHPTIYCPYPGLGVEMLDALAKAANLKIIPYTEKDFGGYVKDRFDLVLNGSIDVLAAGEEPTDERHNYFEFSEELYPIQTAIIKQVSNDLITHMLTFFNIYDSKIWISVVVLWFLQFLCCALSQHVSSLQNQHYNERRSSSLFDSAWHVLRLQLLQSHNDLPALTNKSSVFVKLSTSLFAFFQCYVLLSLFGSFQLASVLRPRQEKDAPLDLLINGVASGKNKLIVFNDENWHFEYVNKSSMYPFPQIRYALSLNPHYRAKSYDDFFHELQKDNRIGLLDTDQYGYYAYRQHGNLMLLDNGLPTIGACLMMRKNHPLMGRLNSAIKFSRSKLSSILRKYQDFARRFGNVPNPGEFRALKIAPYTGVLLLCSIFILISFVCLFAEIVDFRRKKRKLYNFNVNEKKGNIIVSKQCMCKCHRGRKNASTMTY